MRMLGEKERGHDIAGMRTLHVGTAHPMEKRNAIVAGDAHDHAIIEYVEANPLRQCAILGVERRGRNRIGVGLRETHLKLKLASRHAADSRALKAKSNLAEASLLATLEPRYKAIRIVRF